MPKFRKKPVTIEAVQWTGNNLAEVLAWCPSAYIDEMYRGNHELTIPTLEDGSAFQVKHIASRGDWIIRGVAGEYYPCREAIFEATYESVVD